MARIHFPTLLERDDVDSMLTELEARLKAEALVAQETAVAPGGTPNPNLVAARHLRKSQDAAAAIDAAHRRLQADLAASEHAIALIHLEMGKALKAKGDFDGALAEIREATRLRPADSAFREQLDVTLKAKADRDAALAALRHEAAGLKPDDVAGHLGLARRMVAQKDLDGAVAEFRAAIRIKPEDPDAHKDLAGILRERGDQDGHVAECRRWPGSRPATRGPTSISDAPSSPGQTPRPPVPDSAMRAGSSPTTP